MFGENEPHINLVLLDGRWCVVAACPEWCASVKEYGYQAYLINGVTGVAERLTSVKKENL
jgi:hypothetical protein